MYTGRGNRQVVLALLRGINTLTSQRINYSYSPSPLSSILPGSQVAVPSRGQRLVSWYSRAGWRSGKRGPRGTMENVLFVPLLRLSFQQGHLITNPLLVGIDVISSVLLKPWSSRQWERKAAIFHSLNREVDVLNLNEVQLIIFFSFMDSAFSVSQKSPTHPSSPRFSTMLYSRSFIVLHFMLMSMIHLS